MIAEVFNANNPKARAIFTKVPQEDIMETQIVCMAAVDVYDGYDGKANWAYFDEEYNGPGSLHVPYLVLNGTVSEVFFEEEDSRIFPCGAKSLVMKSFDENRPDETDAVKVRVNWRLSNDELAFLFSKGLGKSDFRPPELLRGNRIEIPISIVYTACYDTPVCAVKILNPGKLETSTKYNNYVSLFYDCVPSQQLTQGVDIEYNIDPNIPMYEDMFNEIEASDTINFENEDALVAEDASSAHVLTEDEEQDIAFAESTSRSMSQLSDELHIERDKHDDSFDPHSALSTVNQEAGFDESDPYAMYSSENNGTLTLSDKMNMLKEAVQNMSENNDTADSEQGRDNDEGVITDMTNYDTSSDDDSNLTEAEKREKKEKSGQAANERALMDDVIKDLNALQAGNTDIAGHGASDSEFDKKKEKTGQAAINRAMQDDRIKDLQAVQEDPNADTSGHGAASSKARSLLASISTPQSPASKGSSDGRYL